VRFLVPVLAVGLALLNQPVRSEAKFTFVDFQSQANQRLGDDLHESQGNNWSAVPLGELKFEDSRFKIGEGYLHLMGKSGAGTKPSRFKDLAVKGKFKKLHILHSAGYGENPQMADGTEIGAYTVHYAGGSEERIPIVYGEDVRDWWDWPERPTQKRAKVAWTGTNTPAQANERKIRLFSVVWTNPHPDQVIESLEVSSSETDCDPMVFALSLEAE
jgi:hypothetical protein